MSTSSRRSANASSKARICLRSSGLGFSVGFSAGLGFSGSGFFSGSGGGGGGGGCGFSTMSCTTRSGRSSTVGLARCGIGISQMRIASSVEMISRMRSSRLKRRSLSSPGAQGSSKRRKYGARPSAHAPALASTSFCITASDTLP